MSVFALQEVVAATCETCGMLQDQSRAWLSAVEVQHTEVKTLHVAIKMIFHAAGEEDPSCIMIFLQNGHNLLRQQLQSQRVISTDPVFWEDEPAVILVGDGSHATIADADIVVTLYKECAGRTSQPPRWLPLLSCVRPPDFGSSASEPQASRMHLACYVRSQCS